MIDENLRNTFETTNSQRPTSPLDVVSDTHMPIAAKRALLASWASDARAVPNCPALRRLDDGNLVLIDDVLNALKQLDRGSTSTVRRNDTEVRPGSHRHWSRLARRWRRHSDDDDDDDPPTAPAHASPPSPLTGGTLAAA
jgi:hypothetical protein